MSYIRRVEEWVASSRARLMLAIPGSTYHHELERSLSNNEKLLKDLKDIQDGKQKKLPMREPGEDG